MRSFLFLLLLSGCATVVDQHKKVADWPQLRIVEHFVPNAQMRDKCAPYVGFGSSPIACAEFFFANSECHIYHSADFPPSDYVRLHELYHCLGHDHIGSNAMSGLLKRGTK